MANSGCSLPSRWNMLDAAPAYSAFAAVLGGFLFLGIITLLSVRGDSDSSSGKADRETDKLEEGTGAQGGRQRVDRSRTLMLFLPALLCLLASSFGFGEATGDQVCVRGYIGGMFASSLLAVGALAVFCGIAWMIDAYGQNNDELRRAAAIFIYISYVVIMASLLAGAVDLIDNAFDNKPPAYVDVLLVLYVLLLLLSAVVTRKWFMPNEDGAVAQLAAVYFPAAYLVIIVIIEAGLNTYRPAEWRSFDDWKVYLALSVSLFFPALTMIAYIRALPEVRLRKVNITQDAASGQHRESNSLPAGLGRIRSRIFSSENQRRVR